MWVMSCLVGDLRSLCALVYIYIFFHNDTQIYYKVYYIFHKLHSFKGQDWQATVCCKVGAAALVHLRPVLGGCTILPFNHSQFCRSICISSCVSDTGRHKDFLVADAFSSQLFIQMYSALKDMFPAQNDVTWLVKNYHSKSQTDM